MNDSTAFNEPDIGAPAGIVLHGPDEFEGMRRAGRLAAECLDMDTEHVAPGVTTDYPQNLPRIHTGPRRVPGALGYRGLNRSVRRSTTWFAMAFRDIGRAKATLLTLT